MGAQTGILIDANHGIEYRAVPASGGGGWTAQWRPVRALKRFMTFSYITRNERFQTQDEALDFLKRNAGAIVDGAL
jgi:hypothetical protein